MPVFMAVVEKPAIKYVDEKADGSIIGCDPVAVIAFVSEGGDPHELADEMSNLRGKRVKVLVTLEQPELFDSPEAAQGDLGENLREGGFEVEGGGEPTEQPEMAVAE